MFELVTTLSTDINDFKLQRPLLLTAFTAFAFTAFAFTAFAFIAFAFTAFIDW